MRAVLGTVVDGKDVVSVLWISVVAGLGVTAVFALAILGTTRAVDLRRDGRAAGAAAYAALGALALAGVAAAIVFAIVVMIHKS